MRLAPHSRMPAYVAFCAEATDYGERRMLESMSVKIKRVYEDAAAADGCRVLVDRVWPRGVTKEDAKVDEWLKEVAPSTDLRKWFGHDPEKFADFGKKYRKELVDSDALAELRALVKDHKTVTLVYGAKDEEHNQAVVLQRLLKP